MTIQAQSADGVTHEFPDGTDVSVVNRVMKDYALKSTADLQASAKQMLSGTSGVSRVLPNGGASGPVGMFDGTLASRLADVAPAAVNLYQGITAGAGDELAGGLAAAVTYPFSGFDSTAAGNAYDATRDTIRDNEKYYETKYPGGALTGKVAGAVLTGVGAARALPGVFAGASGGTIVGNTVRAAGAGAGLGAASGFASGEGGFDNRLASAEGGAAAGAALGGAGELAGTAFARVWRALSSKAGAPIAIKDANGNLTPDAIQIAQSAGVSPGQISPDIIDRLDLVAKRGGAPGVDGTDAAAKSAALPVEVPLTRGQLTNDLGQLQREQAIRKGVEGQPAMQTMRNFSEEQQAALRANLDAIHANITGGTAVERGAGGAAVSSRLVDMEAGAKKTANDLFANARRLDEESRASGVPFAPVDESGLGRANPAVESEIGRAAGDVAFARGGGLAADKPAPGIINAIQAMGGIKTFDNAGRLTSEGGDLRDLFNGRYPPGLVNNANGKGRSLDYVREALQEQGWFPGKETSQISTADVLNLIGGRARHPLSGEGVTSRGAASNARARDDIISQLEGLGIDTKTTEGAAALRLAESRTGRNPAESVVEPRALPVTSAEIDARKFGPRLYRETDAQGALEVLPYSSSTSKDAPIFTATHRDLALGQGENKGVLVTFDSAGLDGRLSMTKPTAALLARQGRGEVVAGAKYGENLRDHVVSVEVPDFSDLDVRRQQALRNTLDRMDASGEWDVAYTDKGATATKRTGGPEADARSLGGGGSEPPGGLGLVDLPDSGGPVAAAGFGGERAGEFVGGLYQKIRDKGRSLVQLPAIRGELATLTRKVADDGHIPIGDLFDARERFSGIQRGAPGTQEAVAAGVAKSHIESSIDAALRDGLLDGDKDVIDAYREAVKNYRDYATTFKADDIVGHLVQRDFKNTGPDGKFRLKVDPDQAANEILGVSDLAMVSKRDVARNLIKVRDMLGSNSAEWNALRADAFAKIANKAESTTNAVAARDVSGANFDKALKKFRTENRSLWEVLFTPAERETMGNLADVMRRATTVDKDIRAPSTSPYEMRQVMKKIVTGRFLEKIPIIRPWAESFFGLLGDVRGQKGALDAISGKLSDPRIAAAAARPVGGFGALTGPAALAAGGAIGRNRRLSAE